MARREHRDAPRSRRNAHARARRLRGSGTGIDDTSAALAAGASSPHFIHPQSRPAQRIGGSYHERGSGPS